MRCVSSWRVPPPLPRVSHEPALGWTRDLRTSRGSGPGSGTWQSAECRGGRRPGGWCSAPRPALRPPWRCPDSGGLSDLYWAWHLGCPRQLAGLPGRTWPMNSLAEVPPCSRCQGRKWVNKFQRRVLPEALAHSVPDAPRAWPMGPGGAWAPVTRLLLHPHQAQRPAGGSEDRARCGLRVGGPHSGGVG